MRDISVSEWLTELTKATDRAPDGAMTVVELAEEMQKGVNWTRQILRALAAKGEIALNPVQVRRIAMDGRPVSVPAYRIKRLKKKS